MTFTRVATLSALLFCAAVPASAQAVKIEFHDGKVNLSAQNASLRNILTEWSRLGGTQVVNADRVGGPPLTLELTDVPETQALDIVLRGTAGYIAGARPGTTPAGTRSSLDRILIVPTVGTATAAGARPVAQPPFATPQPQFRQIDPDDDPVSDTPPDDEPPNRGRALPVPRPGPGQTPPQPFQPQDDREPDQQQPANTAPANPFGIQTGSSRPGTISPAPQPTRPQTQPDPEP